MAEQGVQAPVSSRVEHCDFCEIADLDEPARMVLQTPAVVAFFPLEPAVLGHTLVVPRQHIPDIWRLPSETAHELTDATMRIAHAVRDAMNPDGLNIIQSNGAAATQTVFHLHVHVVPRHAGDAIGRIWPPETSWSESAKDEAWDRIRDAIRDAHA
jgi:histidine triad (HIT) family protein